MKRHLVSRYIFLVMPYKLTKRATLFEEVVVLYDEIELVWTLWSASKITFENQAYVN